MKEALWALDKENWTDEIQILFNRLGIREEDVSLAIQSLVKAHAKFVNEPEIKSATEALQIEGWYEADPGARYLIYGRLGEVILGGFFLAQRDVTHLGDLSPQTKDIADFIAEGVRVSRRLDGRELPKNETLELAVESLFAELGLAKDALAQRDHMPTPEGIATLKKKLGDVEMEKLSLDGRVYSLRAELAGLGTFWGWAKHRWNLFRLKWSF